MGSNGSRKGNRWKSVFRAQNLLIPCSRISMVVWASCIKLPLRGDVLDDAGSHLGVPLGGDEDLKESLQCENP